MPPYREIGNTGKVSSSNRCLSSQGCCGRQDFPTSMPVQNPGNAAQFQQVSAASVVGITENWTQQAKVPLPQVAPPARSLEEPGKYLTHEAFICLSLKRKMLHLSSSLPKEQQFPSIDASNSTRGTSSRGAASRV